MVVTGELTFDKLVHMELGKVISKFLDEKIGPPNFYGVQNAQLVSIKELAPVEEIIVEEDNESN